MCANSCRFHPTAAQHQQPSSSGAAVESDAAARPRPPVACSHVSSLVSPWPVDPTLQDESACGSQPRVVSVLSNGPFYRNGGSWNLPKEGSFTLQAIFNVLLRWHFFVLFCCACFKYGQYPIPVWTCKSTELTRMHNRTITNTLHAVVWGCKWRT